MFGLPLALGSVSNLEQELSKALAVPHAEAVRRASVRNVDESGWKRQGLSCPEGKTARFCTNVLQFEELLRTFVGRKQLEPTKNHAEWIVRRLVLWRKITFASTGKKASGWSGGS